MIRVRGLEKITQKANIRCCAGKTNSNIPSPPPIPSTPNQPVDNCQVHFSGVLMLDYTKTGWFSKIYTVDQYSELVGAGEYTDNKTAFPKAVKTTFDGIAIDHGVRLQLFSEINYGGNIVIDVIGPMLINNRTFHYELSNAGYGNRAFTPSHIQAKYPIQNRYINIKSVDMRKLSFGSCKITCGHNPSDSLDIGVEVFK